MRTSSTTDDQTANNSEELQLLTTDFIYTMKSAITFRMGLMMYNSDVEGQTIKQLGRSHEHCLIEKHSINL